MKNNKKIKVTMFVMMAMALSNISAVSASRSYEDSIPWKFTIKSYCQSSYTTYRFRDSDNLNNCWKVNLEKSSEGSGTQLRFTLVNTAKNQVSGEYLVAQGSGTHYYHPYSSASDTDVALRARNNNCNSHTYTASGTWDEEVGY